MATDTKQIVDRAWNFAHVLRDDGLSYMAYIEQITFLLFLKMADERAVKFPNQPRLVPKNLGWSTLLKRQGDELLQHYEHVLESLSRKPGMLGAIFRKPRPDIQNSSTLRRLIVDLIEPVNWSGLEADVKGDIYEGLLARTAEESPKGAGQYFTPRELVRGIIECIQPGPNDTVCDPAAGTGGFLLAAVQYVEERYGKTLSRKQRKHLLTNFVQGWELVPNTARLCIMNLHLHGIDSDPPPVISAVDSLASDPGKRFSVVVTNPPFGRKSTIAVVSEATEQEKEDGVYEREEFWSATKNKQLNFLQHANTLLTEDGRCAIVLPDNVLFEGGAGETIRKAILEQCEVHTLLRLPAGIFYAQGVKANVLFFDAKRRSPAPRTTKLWVYDLRTDMHFTLKTRPLKRADLDGFVKCFKPGNRNRRKPTWSETNPTGRWRCFEYEELLQRDKVNLDLFWLRGNSRAASEESLAPQLLAQEIADNLQTALKLFSTVAKSLKE